MFLVDTCAFDKKFVFGLKRLIISDRNGLVLGIIWSGRVLFRVFFSVYFIIILRNLMAVILKICMREWCENGCFSGKNRACFEGNYMVFKEVFCIFSKTLKSA